MPLTPQEKEDRYRHRKSRWRIGQSHAVQLQERDYTIFQLLFDHGYVTSELLRQYVSPDTAPKVFSRRLLDLRNAPNRYIDVPFQQRKTNVARNYASLIYEITPKATQALLSAGYITPESVTYRSHFFAHKEREFWHDVSAANEVLSIRIAAGRDGRRFITPWAILANAPRKKLSIQLADGRIITPDYLFGFDHGNDTYRFFWFEHDHNTEQLWLRKKGSSFQRKLIECDHMLAHKLYDAQFHLPGLNVLTVTLNERRAETMQEIASSLANRRQFGFRGINPVRGENRVPHPVLELYDGPWGRGDLAPLRINNV